MEDYKPNSHRFKEEEQTNPPAEKKVEKVANGKVKKKNEIRKFADTFISDDAANVKDYILKDVLVPTICKTIVDIITDSVNMIFLGGTGRSRRTSTDTVSYRKYYDRRDDRGSSSSARLNSNRFDYEDILFENRGEAEAVLDQMNAVIDRYGVVTVADLYDMADLSAPYTSNRYGWTNIRSADAVRVRDGYILKLPRAMPID